MAVSFDTEIQFLKGIGEKRAALLHKLGIDTVGDLLNHYPRDYIDLTEPVSALSADPTMPCAVRAMVLSKSGEQHIRKGLSVFKVRAVDPDGTELLLTFFNSKFTVDKLQVDEEYVFYGKVSGSLLRREMNTPLIFTLTEARQLIPVYPQTAGINSRFLAAEVRLALSGLLGCEVRITMPEVRIMGYNEAIDWIGGPEAITAGVLVRLDGELKGIMLSVQQLEFVDLVLSRTVGRTVDDYNQLDELDRSALVEVGNIMISTFINALSGLADLRVSLTVPAFAVDMQGAILAVPMAEYGGQSDYIMTIGADFVCNHQAVPCRLLLSPDMGSLNYLLKKLGVSDD